MAGDNITIDQNVPDAPIHIDTNVPDATAQQIAPNTIAPFAGQQQPAAPKQTVPMFGSDNKLYDVPSEKSKDALAAGGSVASPIIAPDGSHMYVPASKLHDALKNGAKIDDTGWTPEQDKLNHRSVGQKIADTVAGPGTIGEDIASRWNKPTPIDITPSSVHEELSKPLVKFSNSVSPDWQKDHPVLSGLMETADGLTSPENVALMFATEGLGTLSGPESKLAANVVPRVLSAGFSVQQLMDAGQKVPQIWDAVKRGDESEALHLTTLAVAETGMAALGAQHATGVEATPSTGTGRAIDRIVDQATSRLGQALRSDSKAMATANAAHRAATAIFDQRLNEHEMMTDQAVRASQAADDAKVKFSNGEITAQQLDEANTAASAAAANAGKATKALADAHENLSNAAVEADRMSKKISRSKQKTTQKQDQAVAGAIEDFKRMAPPTTSRQGQYSDRDLQIAMGYAEREHQNEPIVTVQDHADAFQKISDDIDDEVGQHIQKYSKDPITSNVYMDVRDALGKSPQVHFVEDGMNYLRDNFNLTDPTLEEAQAILTDLNALNRGTLKKNFWDVATALRSDPEFAARYAAADSLRSGIDGALVDRRVEGVRQLRQDQASVIRVKTAVEKQVTKGGQRVRGSGESGPLRKLASKGAATAGAAAGAGIGAVIPIPGAAEAGAAAGSLVGKKIGQMIAPGDLTRDQLAERVHRVSGKGVSTTDLDVLGNPAGQYGPPSREGTPIHSALSSYFGERLGKSSYVDLEQRFMEGIERKQDHNLPLEPKQEKILAMINDADMSDRAAAQKQLQESAGAKPTPTATLPDKPEPLLRVADSKFAEGMDTHKGIVHEIAHAIVAKIFGINMLDGIGSHLHPEADGAVMVAPIDWTPFLDKDGNVDPEKLRSNIAGIAATYMAGGVANDLYHNIPFTENHHLGTDVKALRGLMKDLGFTDAEASKMIAQAADTAAHILQQPGVQQIIEDHASVREPGLDNKYHISPERMEQINQDVQGALNEHPTGKPTRPSGSGKRTDKEVRAGAKAGAEDRNPTTVRQTRAGTPEGKASDVGEAKPVRTEPGSTAARNEPTVKSGEIIGARPEEFNPINRPEHGWKEPKQPALSELEDEDKLLTSERQTPLRQKHLVHVIDKEGNMTLEEVPAFSQKEALKITQKKHPEATQWGTEGQPKNIEGGGEYTVPNGEPLSMRGKFGRPESAVEIHEVGHALMGLKDGMQTEGMLRHTHPDMPSTARAAVRWNTKNLVDPITGKFSPESTPKIIRNLMAGIAADEAYNDYPREKNHNFDITSNGGDGNTAYKILKQLGMNHEDAMSTMNRAIDQAKSYLTHPVVSDIMHENLGRREAGLSRQYHYSPERLTGMHNEIQRRINGTSNNAAVGGENAQGLGANVGAGQGGSPQATTAAVGAPGEPGAGVGLSRAEEHANLIGKYRDLGYPFEEAVKQANQDMAGKAFPESPKLSAPDDSSVTASQKLKNKISSDYDIIEKGDAHPDDVDVSRGFLLGDGSFIHPDNPQQVHKESEADLKSDVLNKTHAIRVYDSTDYDIRQRPTDHQRQEMARIIRESGNEHVVWDFPTQSGEGSLGDFLRAIDKTWPSEPPKGLIERLPRSPKLDASPEDRKWVDDAKWIENPSTGYRKLELYNDAGKKVGVIAHDNYRIRLSSLDDPYVNRGIGKAMYERTFEDAKQQGTKELMSDTSLSPDAARVWDSLAKTGKYNITSEPSNEVNRGKVGNVFDNLHTQYTVHLDQPKIPESSKFGGLNEKTTGDPEHDNQIKEGGGIPAGVMFPGEPYAVKMFHDPQTGSTLGFKPDETPTADLVRQKLAESRAQYGIKPPESPKLGKMVSENGKSFEEQNYPHTQPVHVEWPEYGDSIDDAVKGLNKGHALARARENWPGAIITPIDTLPSSTNPGPKQVKSSIMPESPKLSSDRVSTRVPEGKNATEDPLKGEPLIIGRKALETSPQKLQDRFADNIRKNVPGLKIPKNMTDTGKIFDRFVNHVADNLKFLYNQSTPEEQTNNSKWFESANKLTKDLAEKHGITHPQAAGVTAAMSPQMDWDQNVSLAKRIVDIYKNHSDKEVTPEMYQKGLDIVEKSRKGADKKANSNLEALLPGIVGKKIGDLTGWDRAAAVRLYDEVNNPRQYPRIDPATGDEKEIVHTQAGVPQNVAWGNLNNIGKALSILDNGSRENISKQVGNSHKVRNFFNNIIDPTNPNDVTIDTHAVAAGTLQPLSGNSKLVTDNFGGAGKSKATGVVGLYPLIADAYRKAAADVGIMPRELQSVTWEKIRNVFPAEWKTKDNLDLVNKEWAKYEAGKQSLNQTRQRILDLPNKLDKSTEVRDNTPTAGLAALGEE